MATATALPVNAVESVLSWSDEEKKLALIALFEDLLARGHRHAMVVRKPDGEMLGYLVPQVVAATTMKVVVPTLTSEEMARTKRALENLDDTFEAKEYFEQLSREDRD